MSAGARSLRPRVGVLALQGGVREHIALLERLGAETVGIRRPEELAGPDGPRVDALVLPGGESSTLDRLARHFDLTEPLRDAIGDGLPTLATCAGLIMLARQIRNPAPEQQSLGLLDATIDRNAFGSQTHSRVAETRTIWGTVRAAFIRAPRIVDLGPGARPAAWLDGEQSITVGAVSGRTIGIAFHPELTGDPTIHRALLDSIG